MSRPMVRIHNVETGEIIDREMNDQEFALWEQEQVEAQVLAQAEAERAAARAALLERLGITEEEAKLLLK